MCLAGRPCINGSSINHDCTGHQFAHICSRTRHKRTPPCQSSYRKSFWHGSVRNLTAQPRSGKASSTLEEAKFFIEALTSDGQLKIWHPTSGFYQRLMDLAHRQDVRGVKIFDLQIALLALELQVRAVKQLCVLSRYKLIQLSLLASG